MSVSRGPNISEEGLVLYLDAANTKSYPRSGTTWTDLSGNNNTGTLTNGPTFNAANGGSIVFDGTNDYVSTTAFNITGNQITLFSWFKFNALSALETALIRKENVWQLGFINSSTGAVRCLLGTSGTTGWTVANDFTYSSFANNTWYYFGFTYNNGTTNFYVNGANIRTITTITGNILSTADTTVIGANSAGSTNFINASVAIPQIYNRALTATEILQNFNATRSRFGV
jgi:hypothetical protein